MSTLQKSKINSFFMFSRCFLASRFFFFLLKNVLNRILARKNDLPKIGYVKVNALLPALYVYTYKERNKNKTPRHRNNSLFALLGI